MITWKCIIILYYWYLVYFFISSLLNLNFKFKNLIHNIESTVKQIIQPIYLLIFLTQMFYLFNNKEIHYFILSWKK